MSAATLRKVNLFFVDEKTDFRKSELTNFDIWKKRQKKKGRRNTMKSNEVLLFISKSGNQLVWVLNIGEVEVGRANKRGELGRRMIDSRKWRIEGSGKWHKDMIQNYANEVGLDIVGMRRLEEKLAA